jgi:hypothetical protein
MMQGGERYFRHGAKMPLPGTTIPEQPWLESRTGSAIMNTRDGNRQIASPARRRDDWREREPRERQVPLVGI